MEDIILRLEEQRTLAAIQRRLDTWQRSSSVFWQCIRRAAEELEPHDTTFRKHELDDLYRRLRDVNENELTAFQRRVLERAIKKMNEGKEVGVND